MLLDDLTSGVVFFGGVGSVTGGGEGGGVFFFSATQTERLYALAVCYCLSFSVNS